MTQILYYSPGQVVTAILETFNSDGYRQDSSSLPIVSRVIFPAFTLASNYPQSMIKLDTGLYYYQFTLPTGAAAIGSYIIDVLYADPVTSILKEKAYQVICNAPYGNFGIVTTI